MEEDVVWIVLLLICPILALVTTIPIHPRCMVSPPCKHQPTPYDVSKISWYNFYAPYGKNRIVYPIFTWVHWVFVFVALGIPPLWAIAKFSTIILDTRTVIMWLIIFSCIASLVSPIYLGPSWADRKVGFEKEIARRNILKRDTLPSTDIKYRYD